MEEELKEELEKIYNIPITVKFEDFRIYNIIFSINKNRKEIKIIYDFHLTIDNNIKIISEKIDKEIVKIFKGEK